MVTNTLTALPGPEMIDCDVEAAVMAACERVGRVSPSDDAWPRLVARVHALCDALEDCGASAWPPTPALACRRLAVAVRRWKRQPECPTGQAVAILEAARQLQVAARIAGR